MMKPKLSRTYLNTLLAGLVGLLTLVLVLLYLIQSSDLFSLDRVAAESRAAQSKLEAIEFKQQIGLLENVNKQQQVQFEAQRNAQLNEAIALKKTIAELRQQLQDSLQAQQATESKLDSTEHEVEKLTLELDKNRSRMSEQQLLVDSSDARLQTLRDQLEEEKRFTEQVRAAHEKDKIRLLEVTTELADKKRELVRSKRELAGNQQMLNARTRELTINQGRRNDNARRNQALEQQVNLLNEEVRLLRERIREQEIAATQG